MVIEDDKAYKLWLRKPCKVRALFLSVASQLAAA